MGSHGDKHGQKMRQILVQLHELIDEELDYIPIKDQGKRGKRSVMKIVEENNLPVEVAVVREQLYAIRKT
jgi:hypothetical protein